jgi:hypothetical protein
MDTAAASAKPKSKSSIIGRIVVWGFVALVVVWFFAARQGKSVAGAIAGPTVLADERVQLKEGQAKSYGINLPTPRKVEIHIGASPKSVDVITVSAADYAQFEKAHSSLFGGNYKYIPALSSKSVMKYDGAGVLAQGSWYVVVMRPQESVLFGDDTNATVRILGY